MSIGSIIFRTVAIGFTEEVHIIVKFAWFFFLHKLCRIQENSYSHNHLGVVIWNHGKKHRQYSRERSICLKQVCSDLIFGKYIIYASNKFTNVKEQRKLARTLSKLVCWEIWNERNRRIFKQTILETAALTSKIKEEAAAWRLAGAPIPLCAQVGGTPFDPGWMFLSFAGPGSKTCL